MKELDRIKREVAIEFSAGNYESFEQAIKVYDPIRMINELCKRYAQLVGENALKEAAENKFHIWQRVLNESHFPVIDIDEDPVKYPTMIGHDDGRGGHHMEYLTREEIIEAWRTEDGFVTWLKPIDKSSITNPKNVKLV